MALLPKSIKRKQDSGILITWNDGRETLHSLELLRDRCPCASCSGETVLMHTYAPPPIDRSTPGRYELKGIHQVGSYAIQLEWGDGHATGIYSWNYLLDRCL